MSLYTELTISKIKEEVEGIKSFYFEGPEAEKVSYKAGQFMTFVLPTEFGEIRRSYSITSSPALEESLSVAVKRIENGVFSRYLVDRAKIGEKLLTSGVGGFFTLPKRFPYYNQYFFFAAGSGITPIFSLIKSALYEHAGIKLVLVYSNRSPDSTLFLNELEELEKRFPDRFTIEWLYSTSADLYRARLHKDLLKSLVKKHGEQPFEKVLFYLCGPENYMVMCSYGLGQLEVPAANIRKEIFTSAKVLPKAFPPDTEVHTVIVKLGDSEKKLRVQYPETILGSARKSGLVLPYSCEVGRCGNCVARCTEGKVWMSYNEVLTERELKEGLVLTCVGYPHGGNVRLEIL